jgi:uncharacterized protein (TIGR02453 family)
MDYNKLHIFLSQLAENNHKDWFDANRPTYESLRKEWILVVTELIAGLQEFEPEMAGLEAKNCMFRINRDIRFSKDKSPYKTNFSAYFTSSGKNSIQAGYYFHFQPGEIFAAGGLYYPESAILKQVRQEIDYHTDEFLSIVEDKKFRQWFGDLGGETTKTNPKGYDSSHKAIQYLKHKSFIVQKSLLNKEGQYHHKALEAFKEMKPLISFLNRAIAV